MNTAPLRYEVHGSVGEGSWYRLYECEHITSGAYPLREVIPIGDHTNLALCRHCFEGFKGRMALDYLEQLKAQGKMAQLRDFFGVSKGTSDEEVEGLLQSFVRRAKLTA